MKVLESIFKPYIVKKDYDGGITRSEISHSDTEGPVWKLSSNENILGPSPLAQRAIMDNISTLHEYGFRDDHSLKEAICNTVTYLRPENIVTANSGIEVLELIARAFIRPGDDLEVVGSGGITIIDPTNLSYSSMDRARRGDPVSLIDVKLHILISGGRFEIQSRKAFAE